MKKNQLINAKLTFFRGKKDKHDEEKIKWNFKGV